MIQETKEVETRESVIGLIPIIGLFIKATLYIRTALSRRTEGKGPVMSWQPCKRWVPTPPRLRRDR
jgi:hypothetical protein